MKKLAEKKEHILLSISKEDKEGLQKLSREISYKEEKFITIQQLIIRAVEEKYFSKQGDY